MLDLVESRGVDPDQPAIIHPTGTVRWGDLGSQASALESRLQEWAGRRVGVRLDGTGRDWALLTALDRLGSEAFLIPADWDQRQCQEVVNRFGLAALLWEPPLPKGSESPAMLTAEREEPGSGESTVVVLTSGTTGKPKAARHTWRKLARPVRTAPEFTGTRWLLCYRPHLYAGLQVALQCLLNRGTLISAAGGAGGSSDSAAAVADSAASHQAQFASATPSYWRWLLTFAGLERLKAIPLRQITLGGEVVDQAILNRLRAVFPDARLVHIYATTELGRCFSVTDGIAGFPARFLSGPSAEGVEMTVSNGELLVRSANGMQGYDRCSGYHQQHEQWVATGDLVERRGDRYVFVGRRNELINVGGNKVSPAAVEQILLSIPGVNDVRIYAKRSSLVGQLVACDIQPEEGVDHQQLKQTVRETCNAALSPYEQPRIVRIVDQLEVSEAGKKVRSAL